MSARGWRLADADPQQAIDTLKSSGTEDVADPAAETQFQNFLGAYFPALAQGLKSGKSTTQLLSAASADYLGKLIPAFTPPPVQPATDRRDKEAPAQAQAAGAVTATTTGPDTNQAAAPRLGTDAMRAWVKDWPVPESGPSMIGTVQSIVRGFADLLDYAHGDLEPGQNISPDAANALSFFASRSPAAGSGKLVAAAAEAKTVGDAQKILGQTSPQELEALAQQSAKEAGAPPPPDAHSEGEAGTPAVQPAPRPTAEARDQTAAVEQGLPGAEVKAGPPLSPLFKIPKDELSDDQRKVLDAEIEALRARVRLPEYDEKNTYAVLFTNEGKIIAFKNADAPAYNNYIPAGHAEGKAALWIKENNSSGGVLLHNNTDGTCGFCDRQLHRLLPEDAKLWVVPPADAVAKDSRAIDYPRQYVGDSIQPLPPKPPQPQLPLQPKPNG